MLIMKIYSNRNTMYLCIVERERDKKKNWVNEERDRGERKREIEKGNGMNEGRDIVVREKE